MDAKRLEGLKALGRELSLSQEQIDALVEEADHIGDVRVDMLNRLAEEKGSKYAVMVDAASQLLSIVMTAEGLVRLGTAEQRDKNTTELIRQLGDTIGELSMQVASSLDRHFGFTIEETKEIQQLAVALIKRVQEVASQTADKAFSARQEKAA